MGDGRGAGGTGARRAATGGRQRRTLRRLLEQEGLAVVEAEHGRAALELLAGDGSTAPGLIVLDLLLPELDGFAFLAKLRRDDRWRDVPVVVLTAKDLTADDRRRLNGRVQRILQKGASDSERLLDEVRRLVAAGVGACSGAGRPPAPPPVGVAVPAWE